MEVWLYFIGGIVLFAKLMDYLDSRKANIRLEEEVQKLKEEVRNFKVNVEILNKEKIKANTLIDKYHNLFDKVLTGLMKESVLLPSLARWANELEEYEDKKIVNYLRRKKRPAHKAAWNDPLKLDKK